MGLPLQEESERPWVELPLAVVVPKSGLGLSGQPSRFGGKVRTVTRVLSVGIVRLYRP